jgi:hypothetical protein
MEFLVEFELKVPEGAPESAPLEPHPYDPTTPTVS